MTGGMIQSKADAKPVPGPGACPRPDLRGGGEFLPMVRGRISRFTRPTQPWPPDRGGSGTGWLGRDVLPSHLSPGLAQGGSHENWSSSLRALVAWRRVGVAARAGAGRELRLA